MLFFYTIDWNFDKTRDRWKEGLIVTSVKNIHQDKTSLINVTLLLSILLNWVVKYMDEESNTWLLILKIPYFQIRYLTLIFKYAKLM